MVKRGIPWGEMKDRYEEGGVSYAALAREYGVSPSAVGKRARNENWQGRQKDRETTPMERCLSAAARQLSTSVDEAVQEGQVSVKELKDLTAMLRELMNLRQALGQEAQSVRVVMEEQAEEWSQ